MANIVAIGDLQGCAGALDGLLARIEGVADTDPFNPKDKFDPRNRRMSITVLYQDQD